MNFSISDGFTYVVDIEDNLKLPEKEQAKINFKFATGFQVLDCLDAVKEEDGEITTKTDNRKEWQYICDSVENINVDDEPIDKMDIYDKGAFASIYIKAITAYRLRTAINKKK